MNCAVSGTVARPRGRRPDVHRVAHVAAGQRHDRAGHRGREQHGLAGLRRHRQDPLDVGQEAEVEHLVGLVEHERCTWVMSRTRRLHRSISRPGVPTTMSTPFAVPRAAARSARRRHGQDAEAAVGAGEGEVLETWSASSRVGATISACGLPLAAGRGLAGSFGGHAALQDRDAERQRLAGAGAGLADQVGPRRATESVISWIGNGVMMPTRSSASAISGSTPSSRNVVSWWPCLRRSDPSAGTWARVRVRGRAARWCGLPGQTGAAGRDARR